MKPTGTLKDFPRKTRSCPKRKERRSAQPPWWVTMAKMGNDDMFAKSLNRDIKPIAEHLSELREKLRESTKQNKLQQKFFAMVAHDAKNPLAAILGYAEILGQRLKNLPTESRYTAHIQQAAQMLQNLITDLVDMAAMESGKLRINPKIMDLNVVFHYIRSRMRLPARRKGVRLSFKCPANVPNIIADPWRMEQVIQNLCNNALQYTPRGGRILVRARKTPYGITVSVSDTGMGISKEDISRIFDDYFQSKRTRETHHTGLGMGLSICREILRLHNSEISVNSKMNEGSTFFFTLPLNALPKKS